VGEIGLRRYNMGVNLFNEAMPRYLHQGTDETAENDGGVETIGGSD